MKYFNKKRTVLFSIAIIGLLAFKPLSDNLFEISKNLSIFSSVYKEIGLNYVDETRPGELMKTGIDAMLASLDPYTNYYPESKMEDFKMMTTGEYGGIGTMISKRKEYILITEVYEGFGAQKAGLMAGDKVYKVDGTSAASKTNAEVSELLKGQSGTEVVLTIKRGENNETQEIIITREKVKIPSVPYSGIIDDKIGYIKFTSFTQNSSQLVKKAFDDLKSNHKIESVVLDLRGNGGGLLNESVNIVNLFIPKGEKVVETKGRIKESNRVYYTLTNSTDKEIPLVVLVDGSSASASEIVSGSIQDLDRGVVIGETSFGKGLVQQTRDLDYNTKVKFTVAKYYTPSGRCIQKLDYSNKKNGKVNEVADSLLSTFKTKNGREVKDGRGVEPDVKVDAGYYSNLTASLMVKDVIFNFATNFRQANPELKAAKDFKVEDTEYKKFIEFALTQEFEYKTVTEEYFKQLKEVAEKEKYFAEAESEFDALLTKVTPNKENDLVKYKSEIIEILESEIASRYYYQKGRIEVSFKRDPYIQEAIRVLNNSEEYRQILEGK